MAARTRQLTLGEVEDVNIGGIWRVRGLAVSEQRRSLDAFCATLMTAEHSYEPIHPTHMQRIYELMPPKDQLNGMLVCKTFLGWLPR